MEASPDKCIYWPQDSYIFPLFHYENRKNKWFLIRYGQLEQNIIHI